MTGTFRHRMETQYKINERFQTQDVEGLKKQPSAYKFLLTTYPKELEALKNKEIDYIVLSSDL